MLPLKETLILIPAFNEEKNIQPVIKIIKENYPQTEILVVDDGSKDRTSLLARESGAHVINLPFNLGYGVALQTGYKYALEKGYKYLVQLDGDGQHDPVFIKDLLQVVQTKEADLALGSRFKADGDGGSYSPGFFKKTGIKLFAFITSLLIKQRVTDPTSGYQAMNRDVLKFCVSDFYPFDFPDADVLLMLHRAGFRIKEVPVIMHPGEKERSMHQGLVPLYYVFKMFLSIFVELLRKSPG